MIKQIATIFGILLMISLVSAIEINITAGENYSFDLGDSYDYYVINGNSTEVDLNITQNGTNVTINFGKYMKEDIFTIIFFNEEDELIESITGSSSSSHSGICYRGWIANEWSECIDNK